LGGRAVRLGNLAARKNQGGEIKNHQAEVDQRNTIPTGWSYVSRGAGQRKGRTIEKGKQKTAKRTVSVHSPQNDTRILSGPEKTTERGGSIESGGAGSSVYLVERRNPKEKGKGGGYSYKTARVNKSRSRRESVRCQKKEKMRLDYG